MEYFLFVKMGASVQVSEKEFRPLFAIVSHHYDDAVRRMAKVGGWLFGIRNMRDFRLSQGRELDAGDLEMIFEGPQLQLVLKALEMDLQRKCPELNITLWKIVNEIREKQQEINRTLNGA